MMAESTAPEEATWIGVLTLLPTVAGFYWVILGRLLNLSQLLPLSVKWE